MANGSSTLKKITARAKQIRKGSKTITWKTAVKKAGAEYRAGKISGKKSAVKKVSKKVSKVSKKRKPAAARHSDQKSHNVNIRVVSGVSKIASLAAMQKRQALADIQQEQRNIQKEMDNLSVIAKLSSVARKEKSKPGLVAMVKSRRECLERIRISRRKINSLKKFL